MVAWEARSPSEGHDAGAAEQMLERMAEHVLGLSGDGLCIVPMELSPESEGGADDRLAEARSSVHAELLRHRPRFLLIMGPTATRALLGAGVDWESQRGEWRTLQVQDFQVQSISTFHPVDLLRQPQDKRLTFMDLKRLRGALDSADG